MDPLVPFAAVCATVLQKVHSHINLPFIDEQFHLRQCAVFCAHNFWSWDPKITTPPGLYVLGTIYSHVLRVLGVAHPCGNTALRSLSFVGGVPMLYAVLSLLPLSRRLKVNVLSLPLLFTYNFLFYTDVWSTVLVVAALVSVLRWPNAWGTASSAVFGFLSLWFRQTNIVWLGFVAAVYVDTLRQQRPKGPELGGFLGDITAFVATAAAHWRSLLPFAANGLGFLAFLKWNGGITFGDKENHQLCVHIVQVFYCVVFMAFFTVPIWLSPRVLSRYGRFCGVTLTPKLRLRPLRILALLGTYAAIAFLVRNFSVVHPFLLADNRHYTFYIYRRLLSKPWSIYVVTPVYHMCTWLVAHLLCSARIGRSLSPITAVAFYACMAATLVPSPLFEPRYFIVPLVLFRIFIVPADNATRRLLAEFTWYTTINVIFFVIFFNYEFTWYSQEGVQRIIW